MIESTPEIENRFEIKLYHPDEGVKCSKTGHTFKFSVVATRTALRNIIETEQHGFWKGDKCQECGTLAKVSIS